MLLAADFAVVFLGGFEELIAAATRIIGCFASLL
jgi:hypothetical protein